MNNIYSILRPNEIHNNTENIMDRAGNQGEVTKINSAYLHRKIVPYSADCEGIAKHAFPAHNFITNFPSPNTFLYKPSYSLLVLV